MGSFCLQLQLPCQQSAVKVRQAPPSGFYLYVVKIPQSTTNFSLPSAFINSYFRVVFKIRPSPLFEKQVFIGGSHPSLPNCLSYEVTYWRFIIYIISRTNVPVYPYLGIFANFSESPTEGVVHRQELEVLRNAPAVSSAACLQRSLINTLTTASVWLHVYE